MYEYPPPSDQQVSPELPGPWRRPLGAVDGLRAFAGGIEFIVTTPSVWGYALVPVGMVLVLISVFGTLGVWGALRATHGVLGEPVGTWATAGHWLLTALLALLALLVAAVLALSLAQPLSGFALERIVDAQERALTGRAAPRLALLHAAVRGVTVSLLAVVVGTPVLLALFLVNLVFPPAAVVTVPLKLLVCGWMLAWDFLDYPLGLRGLGLFATLGWVRRHGAAFTAFGVAWAVLLVVPGLVLVVLPMGVAGATRLVVQDELAGNL